MGKLRGRLSCWSGETLPTHSEVGEECPHNWTRSRRMERVQPGEPVAGNPLGGFCEGGRAQATWSQDSSLPTIAGFFFIRWNLPETKGKTLEEIEGTWDRSARDDAPGA